ncbi:helix-turn-helix domain-containing protein [Streptomyces sp. NRRL B-24572]|uniref:helix-turn-helix domain-containing protein n=1 Tax=Streptomyces sp. NRRL B-24572 TaxID=1962156 RepID=UPI0015C51667|nr:helix-turn-helix domain-containing protein [Streptomyces sp. NRRL B-24572]
MADVPAPCGQTPIRSIRRALRLLRALEQRVGGAGAEQPARGAALPTTYHLLRTLVHEGVVRDGPRRCELIDLATEAPGGMTEPPVGERMDFRAGAHAHAGGRAVLAQLGREERADHLARHLVDPVHPARRRRF